MSVAWNPRLILNIHPELGGSCVGTTLIGTRCGNSMISVKLRREAAAIIDDVPYPTQSQQNQAQVVAMLRRLAYCLLCPRLHQGNETKAGSQIDPVARKWLSMLLQFAVAPGPATNLYYERPQFIPTPVTTCTPRIRRIQDAYPSPPTSPSPSWRFFSVHSTAGSKHSGSRDSASTLASPPSTPSSTARSSSSRISVGNGVTVNVNVSVSVNNRRQRQTTSILSEPSNPPPSPSPSRSVSRRLSLASLQSGSAPEDSDGSDTTLRRQPSEPETRLSRTCSQSSDRTIEAWLRSSAPTPSTLSVGTLFTGTLSAGTHSQGTLSVDTPRSGSSNGSTASQGRLIHTPDSSGSSTSTPPLSATTIPEGPVSPRHLTAALARIPTHVPSSPNTIVAAPFSGLPRRKRIINEPCYMCRETLHDTGDAVWCRRGCGENVCKLCFGYWKTHLEDQGLVVTCGFWYVVILLLWFSRGLALG